MVNLHPFRINPNKTHPIASVRNHPNTITTLVVPIDSLSTSSFVVVVVVARSEYFVVPVAVADWSVRSRGN